MYAFVSLVIYQFLIIALVTGVITHYYEKQIIGITN